MSTCTSSSSLLTGCAWVVHVSAMCGMIVNVPHKMKTLALGQFSAAL